MPTHTIQERRTYAREQAEREAAVRDLTEWLDCLDRLKLHAEEFSDTWEALCREQRDVRLEIERLQNHRPATPAFKARATSA